MVVKAIRFFSISVILAHLAFSIAGFMVNVDKDPLYVSFSRSGEINYVRINWDGFLKAFAKGCSTALILGGFSASLSIALGGFLGLTLGYSERWSWLYEVLLAAMLGLPPYFLVEMLVSVGYERSPLIYILVLGTTLAVRPMALVFNEVRGLRREDFVVAAEIAGNRPFRIVFVHILPHVYRQLLISWVWIFVFSAVLEANFSYLGIGFGLRDYSWGVVLKEMKRYVFNDPFPFVLFGGLMSLILVGYIMMVLDITIREIEE